MMRIKGQNMKATAENSDRRKIIFVVGQESSGSRLVAKACAASFGIVPFSDWNAIGWAHGENVSVCHRSLPFGTPPKFPNIDRWKKKYGATHDLFFVLTTRDVNLSDLSKMEMFGKSTETVKAERTKVLAVYSKIMKQDAPYFLFSYETLMFLQKPYWQELYKFLGLSAEDRVFPDLIDANEKRIFKMHAPISVLTQPAIRTKRLVRGRARRFLDWIKGEAD